MSIACTILLARHRFAAAAAKHSAKRLAKRFDCILAGSSAPGASS